MMHPSQSTVASRRQFLRNATATLLALGPTLEALCVSEKTAQGAERLGDAAMRFERFVTSQMSDQDGLCLSFLNAETLRPFTKSDLARGEWPTLLEDWFQNAPDKVSCMLYENSLMSTGEFAMSQMAKYRVTQKEEAKDRARRSILAILAVIDEGRYYAPGYLPKPLGGLRRARYSHEMSIDQYTKAIAALDAWRPWANRSEQERIERFFIDAAEFFIARKWRHAYRHRTIVTADTHLHALGLFVPLAQLAANVSGDKSYLRHLSKFGKALDASMKDEVLANYNQCALIIEGFHVALANGCSDPRLRNIIASVWARSAALVNEDGVGIDPSKKMPTSQTTRIAGVATLVKKWTPGLGVTEVAWRILERLTEVKQMTNPRVPGAIADTSVSSWLLGYWRLREFALG